MAITWTDVVNIEASLSTTPVASQIAILADVELRVGTEWGARRDLALKYLAAHLGLVSKTSGAGGGPVSSESVGAVSRSYAVASEQAMADLGGTAWGREYLAMARAHLPRVLVT
jgi:hypothetical protein